ncbi:TetR/AcrR family transcriptional regulator [Novosphingobium sp. BL-8H]|uniref:TetR/AcrR family transcriptional regulator n=1 Tax=Novosphingobium sp. BL-8H TaxID=3127640 RepID=UPI0037568F3F
MKARASSDGHIRATGCFDGSRKPATRAQRNVQKSRSEDLRVAKSYHALRDAFLELLKSNPMEHISILGIARKARVTVPVFYRQFSSKEALLSEIADVEIGLVLDHVRLAIAEDDRTGPLLELCALVDEKREIWNLLLTGGAATSLRSEFCRSIAAMDIEARAFSCDLPRAMATTFLAHGVFDVLAWWLGQAQDHSHSSIADVLQSLVFEPATRRD